MIGEVAGTPEYLSPEQAAGVQKLDARRDIFSLEAGLYELLTRAAILRDTLSDLLRRIKEDDVLLPRRRAPVVKPARRRVREKHRAAMPR